MSRPGDYQAVRSSIASLISNTPPELLPPTALSSQSNKPSSDSHLGPILVRLAWHCSGTYDKGTDTGGSEGAGMRWEKEGGDPANKGLQWGRRALEVVKAQHSWISYSDLWTLAGVVAIEEMGGPQVDWKPGRSDFKEDSKSPPRGRLPDGAQAADHLRHVFYRMGFNDQEIVALSGGHNLGRCHPSRSGFSGPWVSNPTRFSNSYFRLLKNLKWSRKTLPPPTEAQIRLDGGCEWEAKNEDKEIEGKVAGGMSGGDEKMGQKDQVKGEGAPNGGDEGAVWQWVAKVDEEDEEEEELMMLPTDMALIEDSVFKPWVDSYAEDKDIFFEDFAKVFAKLIELGVKRQTPAYSAPKKSEELGAPPHVQDQPQSQAHAKARL